MNKDQVWTAILMAASCALGAAACDSENEAPPTGDDHRVYFVGYAYDGATGARLTKAQVPAITIKYRDKVIAADVEADGRFVSKTPLPTWQDYAVSISAAGYRPFVSQNFGIDVPDSVAMTDGLVSGKTTQTFQMEANLFPVALKAPKFTLTIDQADALAATMPMPRASGQVRFSPKSLSVLEGTAQGTSPRVRRWLNDEDLRNQTISKVFAEGKVEVAEGEMVYGVAYEITVFGVAEYQPKVFPELFVAGQVASRTLSLQKEQKDPLRILASNADVCVPPAGSASEFGGALTLEFNEAIEFVGANAAEDIDNGVSITPAGSSAFQQPGSYCSLRSSLSPTVQERGSKVAIAGNKITFSFNPATGLNMPTNTTFPCVVPANLTSITYGNLQNVSLRPIGDSTRKKTLSELVMAFATTGSGSFSTQLVCGSKQSQF